MTKRVEILQQFKDKVQNLQNGDLIFDLMMTAYSIGNTDGQIEVEERYTRIIENYKKLVELMGNRH